MPFQELPEGQTSSDPVEELIERFVRDVCAVQGMLKSEVCERLEEIIDLAVTQERLNNK